MAWVASSKLEEFGLCSGTVESIVISQSSGCSVLKWIRSKFGFVLVFTFCGPAGPSRSCLDEKPRKIHC